MFINKTLKFQLIFQLGKKTLDLKICFTYYKTCRRRRDKDGMWRSLVAHLAWDEGVARSNRVIPTIQKKTFRKISESLFFNIKKHFLTIPAPKDLQTFYTVKIIFYYDTNIYLDLRIEYVHGSINLSDYQTCY